MRDRVGISAVRDLLARAIADRLFPAAVAEVGDSHQTLWRESFGALSFADSAPLANDAVIFDLASLTKPIATTSIIMSLVAGGRLALDELIGRCFHEWRGADRAGVTVQDLLEQTGGLAARLVDPAPLGRREFEHEISVMPLEYPPRSKAVYSDLGFILLGFLAEDRGGRPLAALFDEVVAPASAASGDDSSADVLRFLVPRQWRARTAPTMPLPEDPRRGRLLTGEVHDAFAARLGGAAGHAGLFGTSSGVGRFARAMLRGARGTGFQLPPLTTTIVQRAIRKSTVPGSSRALGWDTMLTTSSCGSRMSPAAFGHVGFTGTSLWIDPVLERYFVLLTNRACGGGSLDGMREVRRAFHDALIQS